MLTPVPFYFLRHGETDWNRRRVMQGQTDIELNAQGIAQAEGIAADVARLPIVTICCSPLLRARRTADIVNRSMKPVVEIPDLMECRFGIYEGQPSNGPWREPWEQGGALPGGEAYEEYIARALRGLNQALQQKGPMLVVAHGGTFWAIERHATKGSGFRIPNCVLLKLEPPAAESTPWTSTQIASPEGASLAIGEIGSTS